MALALLAVGAVDELAGVAVAAGAVFDEVGVAEALLA